MRALSASALCVFLAGIGALLHSNDGCWQRESPVYCSTAPQEDNDIIFMLQAKGVVELAQERKGVVKHKSSNLTKLGTSMHNLGLTAVSSNLAADGEPEVMTTAASDDMGGWQSHSSLSLASAEMLRTTAISLYRVFGNEGIISVLIFFGFASLYAVVIYLLKHWAESFSKERMQGIAAVSLHSLPSRQKESMPHSARIEERASLPSQERASFPDGRLTPPEQTWLPYQARFSLSTSSLPQGSASVQGDNAVVIRDSLGKACLYGTISTMIEGTRIYVSTPQGKRAQRVAIRPPPYTLSADATSLEIHGHSAGLFGEYLDLHGTSASFKGTLNKQDSYSYAVLKDQRPVMYLRAGANANNVSVTTGHGKPLASVRPSDIASNAERDFEIWLDESDDAIIVIACALAVVIRVLV